jgi:hypothetical protein
MDACRGIFAEWGPNIQERTEEELFQATLPSQFQQGPPVESSQGERDMWSLAFWIATAKAKDRLKQYKRMNRGLDDEAEAEIQAVEDEREEDLYAFQRPIDY